MGAVGDLIGTQEFQLGFVLGTAALVVVLALAWALPSLRPRRRGLVGPALIVAAFLASAGWVGLRRSLSVEWYVVVGAVLVFAGMEASVRVPQLRGWWWFRPLLLIPGAALVAFASDFGRPWWLPWLVFLGAAICGPLVADFDLRSARLGLGPVLFAMALGGAYLYLPENDALRGLLGAAIPLAIAGVPLRAARVGDGGSAVATMVFCWFVAREANNVPIQSWVMIFALGLLITEPIGHYFGWSRVGRRVLGRADSGPWNIRRRVHALTGRGADMPTIVLQGITIVLQGGVVLYVSRVAGLSERYPGDSALPMVLLIPAVVVGMLFGLLVGISPRFHSRRLRSSRRASSRSAAASVVAQRSGRRAAGASGRSRRPSHVV